MTNSQKQNEESVGLPPATLFVAGVFLTSKNDVCHARLFVMSSPYPILELESTQFPALLKEIPDAPKKLYTRGTLPDSDKKHLVVVGSRSYTPYGKQVCERLITGLRGHPVVIVSGLALGIDGIAHTAALEAGIPTIAVPGSGLDDKVLYPATHRPLARKILESGGCLLSEFEPMWKPRPESFPQRNRIMAGMSHAVLVIEAQKRSGTLITSRLATEYNRDVFAVPGPIHSSTSAGPHMLIKKGAALIEKSEDILEAFDINPNDSGQMTLDLELSKDEERVRMALKNPLSRDELFRTLNMPITEFNVLISALEIKGLIVERMGLVEWVQ